jgi:hypothetical protein
VVVVGKFAIPIHHSVMVVLGLILFVIIIQLVILYLLEHLTQEDHTPMVVLLVCLLALPMLVEMLHLAVKPSIVDVIQISIVILEHAQLVQIHVHPVDAVF